MARIGVLLALLIVAASRVSGAVGGETAAAAAPVSTAALTAFIDGAVANAMTRDHIAGVEVAVVKDDTVLLAKGYGVSGLAPARQMTADTLTRVGSLSKTVVWIAIMQLVEQHKISLDDPINLHLPAVLQVPDDGFEQPIRVRHLMTHTAGFEDTILGHMIVDDPQLEMPAATYLARYRPRRVRPPGEFAVYSNYGAALAGMLVAHVSGMPWEEYAEKRILRPLGMRSSTFREYLPQDVVRARGLPASMSEQDAALLSAGFRWKDSQLERAPAEYITHFAPAGALVASANDMAQYMGAFLDPQRFESAGVLTAASVHEMFAISFSNAPGFGTVHHGLFQFPFPGGQLAIGHDGDTLYRHAVMLIVPTMRLGLFVAVNTAEGLRLIEKLPYQIGTYLQGLQQGETKPGSRSNGPVLDVDGDYLPLRRAYFRTERAFLDLAQTTVKTASNGDLLVSGLNPDTIRFERDGQTYREIGGPAQIAFRQNGKQLVLLDPTGSNPLGRIGFFASTVWLLIVLALAHLVAIGGTVRAVRNRRAVDSPRWAEAWSLVPGLWLVSFVLAWIGVMPLLGDTETMATKYPGTLFPIACWMFMLAGIITVALGLLIVIRRPPWPLARWLSAAVTFCVFVSCAATFWHWGLLGFSGW